MRSMSVRKNIFRLLCWEIVALTIMQSLIPFLIGAANVTKVIAIHPIADTYVNAYEPNTNYGASKELEIWYWSPTRKYIAFLKFDLSSIPTEASITRAVFHAFLISKFGVGKTTQAGVHFVSENAWNEYEITWNNIPSYRIVPSYINKTIAFEEVSYSWIVTGDVLEALPKGVFSFALVSEVESDIDSFGSKESANKPSLEIEYVVPDETPPVVGVPIRTPSGNIEPDQQVKVSVSITDAVSGVKNATLLYTVNDGTIWTTMPMNFNSASGYYEATIPSQPKDTVVKYEIIAYDNAGNYRFSDNNGQFYVYVVVPEFPSFLILSLFMIATLLVVILYKRKCLMRCHVKISHLKDSQ